MSKAVVVKMEGITKVFGKVVANEDVNLTVRSGEIHALLGENGAGKSTLMNMLSGIYSPDSGSIFIRGKQVQFTSPKQAIESGIGMVHQHFKLVDRFKAKENIIAGEKGNWFTQKGTVDNKILKLCEKFNLAIDLNKKVQDMSVGEKQMLEIIKVLYRGADILILDEPTAVLTPQEVDRLFDIVRRMKEQGCAVIIITHKLHEVMSLCDKVTILRRGKSIRTVDISETNPKHLTELMVGHATDLQITRNEVKSTKNVYEVKNLTILDKEKVKVLENVSFNLQSGKILGVAGIAGSGQKELCEALVGLQSLENGELLYEGVNLVGQKPREIYKKGISMSFIPEDRLGMGLVGTMGIVDNLLLKEYHSQKGFFVDRKSLKERAKDLVKRLQVKTPGIEHPVKQLSGGNIQKVLLGREIEANPHVLITAYAVRGLDIGATHQIYDLLNEQKDKGVAIMYVGEDLDVLLQLCDDILVLCDGKVSGVVESKKATRELVGLMMAGSTLEEARKEMEGGENHGI